MTISIAWIRRAGKSQELIVASDSRLTSVGHVDVCQKIFPLERGDSFFAFCGDTILAFPFVFQLQSSIRNFRKAADRSEDVTTLLDRVLRLLNAYRDSWIDTIESDIENTNRTTRFLFGGWSWREGKFRIYALQYNYKAKRFTAYTHSNQTKSLGLPSGEKCLVIGNYAAEFRRILREKIKNQDLKVLNYEPLDILAKMLTNPRFTDRSSLESYYSKVDKPGAIGGSPQALKIYQHANTTAIGIRWPLEERVGQKIHIFGRPLFAWENTFCPIYNVSNQEFYYPLSEVSIASKRPLLGLET